MSNESNRRPMGLRARADRWSSKVVGGLTILVALALIAKLSFGPAVGGVFILYGGLLLFPMTRRKASFGVFGFTKLRRAGAQILWMALCVVGILLMLMITQPWAS